jgi:pimeloyl-ACP methyl ester carboxylesterase
MPRIEISGIGVEYELLGPVGAPAVAITPGGRMSLASPGLRELGEALAARGKRVLLWDRPNCGASDVCFEGEHESLLQGLTLTGLIRALDLGPTALAGGSAGSRCSLLAAAHDPEVVSHLIQWWISGGAISLMALAAAYYSESAITAAMGGMAAVAALPAWAEQTSRNPQNRERILAQAPERFIATMERWAAAFAPSATSPVPGMTPEDFARLTMPVLILRGSTGDLYHPARISEQVHGIIPHSELIDPPWPDELYIKRMTEAARTGTGHFLDWPLLAPQIDAFVSR